MRKALAVLLILAAILLGAMYAHYLHLKQKGTVKSIGDYISYLVGTLEEVPTAESVVPKGESAPAPEKPVTPPKTIAAEKEPIEPSPEIKPEKPKVAVDVNLLNSLLRESEELYRKMNYKESAQKSREIISVLENAKQEDSELHKKAIQIHLRSRAFGALISKIPPSTLSDGKGLEKIELDTHRIIIARVLKEDPKTGALTIQQNDGIQATLSEDQIKKRSQITQEEYLKSRAEELVIRIARAKKDQYFDIFSVALFAIQNRLTDRVTELLEKAFAIDGSELAYETFYTEPDRAEMVALLLESFGRGERIAFARGAKSAPSERVATAPEKSAPELAAPSSPEPFPEDPGSGGAEPEKADRSTALRYFAKAQFYARDATLYPDKRFQLGWEAKKNIEKAVDILDKLAEEKPGDTELEQLLIQANDLLHHIIHNLVGVEKK